MRETRNKYRLLVGTFEKRPLRRPRRIRYNNITTDLRKIGCEGGVWMELAEDPVHWGSLIAA
jgi:hypothetical protein